MSFRELLQAIAMLVPTLLVVLAAAVSIGHTEDQPSASDGTVAAVTRDPPRHARSSFDADAEYEDVQ